MPGATEAFTTAGSTLAICAAAPTSNTQTAYAALSFTPIGEITDLGSIGRTYNLVNFSPIGERGIRKIKGSFDDGTMAIQMAFAPGDAGQVIVEAGLDDDDFYSFKLVAQDGTILYFRAQITSAPVAFGGVDSITSQTVNVSIKSGSIIRIVPA